MAAAKKQEPKRLAGFVYVDGVAYGPESEVPDEVAARITNPKAWSEAVKADPDA